MLLRSRMHDAICTWFHACTVRVVRDSADAVASPALRGDARVLSFSTLEVSNSVCSSLTRSLLPLGVQRSQSSNRAIVWRFPWMQGGGGASVERSAELIVNYEFTLSRHVGKAFQRGRRLAGGREGLRR